MAPWQIRARATSFVFSTNEVRPEQRFDWAQAMASLRHVAVTLERTAEDPYFATTRHFLTEGLELVYAHTCQQVISRTRQQIAFGGREQICLTLVTAGSLVAEQRGRTVIAFPGDAVILRQDEPFHIENRETVDSVSVYMGQHRFPVEVLDRTALLLTPRMSPLAEVAAGYMRSLPRSGEGLAEVADFAADQLAALVARGMAARQGQAGRADTTFDAIRAAVEAEIHNPDLSAKLLCVRLGLSRTALFEAVAAEGRTLGAMVLERRLAGCIGDMARAGGAETLATISGRWGFRDQSTFNRAFKRRFGEAPTRWKRDGR